MEESILGITKLVNAVFGKLALALLTALHIKPGNPEYPIPNHIAMELLVFAPGHCVFLVAAGAAFGGKSRRHAAGDGASAAQSDVAGRRGLARKQYRPRCDEISADDRQHRALRVVLAI